MSKDSRCVIGVDLGDVWSHYSVADREGVEVDVGRVATTKEAFRRHFERLPSSVVVLETGTHSPWASRLVRECGHESLVANSRQLALIYKSTHKSDRLDARRLALLALVSPELLSPVEHRTEQMQLDLEVLRARSLLVGQRTACVNHVRNVVKSLGGRLKKCSTRAFVGKVEEEIPEALQAALAPMLALIEQLNGAIGAYDRQADALSKERYPETERMRQVNGVGMLTALYFRLTLGNPERFRRSRKVGAYCGLAPRKDASGSSDPQRGITKSGSSELRVLLTQCAHYILGPFGKDSDLRRAGRRVMANGGKNAKKRALVAVARRLAVLLHRLWVTGAKYDPLREARGRGEVEAVPA